MQSAGVGRHLGVHHQSVANRVKAHAEKLPIAPFPEKVENAEMDEIFTFCIGQIMVGQFHSSNQSLRPCRCERTSRSNLRFNGGISPKSTTV
jgi:hypothetical protein